MKRLLLMAVVALTLACEEEASITNAQLSGLYDVVQVESLLFVTSSERSELRAIDLAANPKNFVRAPNPLEPLSIPTKERPTALATNGYFTPDRPAGYEPLLFSISYGKPIVSVIGAAPERLKELTGPRGSPNEVSAAGPLTAVAACHFGGVTQLFIATFETVSGSQVGNVYRAEITVDEAGLAKATNGLELVRSFTGESITALAVLPVGPPTAPTGVELAIGRRTFNAGAVPPAVRVSGSVEVISATAPGASVRTLSGFGAVKLLRTANTPGAAPQVLVYGVLDEEADCAGVPCKGVVAARASDGSAVGSAPTVFVDSQGADLGIIAGLAVADGIQVPVIADEVDPAPTLNLTGMATSTTGRIWFFNAETMKLAQDETLSPPVPTHLTLDQSLANGIFRFPAAATFATDPPGSPEAGVKRAYIAYPSANALVELVPLTIAPNTPNNGRNNRGLLYYQ